MSEDTGTKEPQGGLTPYERRNIRRSFGRSLLAMLAALSVTTSVTMLVALPAIYVIAFMCAAGGLVRMGSGSSGLPQGLTRVLDMTVVKPLAFLDLRITLAVVVVLAGSGLFIGTLVHVFLDFNLTAAARDPALVERLYGQIAEALRAMTVWSNPFYVVTILTSVAVAVLAGLYDGLWVGAAAARHGVRLRHLLPSGKLRRQWKDSAREKSREEREQREFYWRGPR